MLNIAKEDIGLVLAAIFFAGIIFALIFSYKSKANLKPSERKNASVLPYNTHRGFIEIFSIGVIALGLLGEWGMIAAFIGVIVGIGILLFAGRIKCEECGGKSFKYELNDSSRYCKCNKCGAVYKQEIKVKDADDRLKNITDLGKNTNRIVKVIDICLTVFILILFFVCIKELEGLYAFIAFFAVLFLANYIHYCIHIIRKCPSCSANLKKSNNGFINEIQYSKCPKCERLYKQTIKILVKGSAGSNKNELSGNGGSSGGGGSSREF